MTQAADSSSSLTVALVLATPGTGWGGMETHTVDLAQALSDRGHRVHLFAHEDYRSQVPDSIVFQALPFGWGRRNPLLRFRLRRALKSLQPDVVHAQGNKAADLVGATCPDSAVSLGSVHGTKSSHKTFRKLSGIIGVSVAIVTTINRPNTRLIYNGRELPAPDRSPGLTTDHSIPEGQPLVVAAGRLEPVKQFDRLIRAWVDSKLSGQLVILGEGSERNTLEKLISSLNAVASITLPGHETHLLSWLNAATACVISSEREGFPYIMVESLLAGCPVLSTPVSGVSEFLPPSAISASGATDELTTLLKTTLNSPDQLKARQADAFAKARSTLSLDRMVSETEAFYRDLLATRYSVAAHSRCDP